MIVECGHCGAPLDIKEGASVVTCAYCAKKNKVAVLKTIAATTPSDFKAPEVWKASETSTPLAYHPSKPWGAKGIVILVAIVGLIGGISYALYARGATVEEVTKLPLDSTPRRIEKDLYVTYTTDDGARVTFAPGAAGPYEHLFLRWDDKDTSLFAGMSLFVKEGSTIGPNVIPTLDKALHGGVDKDGHWHWGPASLNVERTKGSISIDVKAMVDKQPNLLRKRQLAALWQIACAAAFGGALPPREEIVAVLGGGYPLAKIGAFDLTTPFATARTSVPKLFPGALLTDYVSFQIALDHPLIRSVGLTWDNAAAGRVRSVHFLVTPAFRPRLSALVTCLTKELGTPETHVDNFADGMQSSIFTIRSEAGNHGPGVTMHVGNQANLYINELGETFPQPAWKRAFEALDRCR